MALPEQEALFSEGPNYFSKSDLLRQLSIHSSSSMSSSGIKRSARVTKQTSASNSPHHVQRRRTTANHGSRTNPQLAQDSAYRTRDQRLRNYYSSQQAMQYNHQRPMSWHPGGDVSHLPSAPSQYQEPIPGHTIGQLERLAVNDIPTSSLQQSIHDAFSMGYGYPLNPSTTPYSNASSVTSHHGRVGPDEDLPYDTYPLYSVSDQAQPQCVAQSLMRPVCGDVNHQLPQNWSNASTDVLNPPPVIYAMPETYFAPVQAPPKGTQRSRASDKAQISKKKSKELVGMGLYDDKESDFMSDLNSALNQDPSRDSLGKGLKLEETWQPPNEDEDEDDGDAYSTDEAEEFEEIPPEPVPSIAPGTQKPFYPHTDLSNQSFFFDEDEFVSDNQYPDYYSMGQGLHGNLPNQIPNPGVYNYMWQ